MTTLSLFSLLDDARPGDPDLTDGQREAVERRDGSLLVHAGAGSGKTRVLVERFVRAVLDDGVAPERILAITFTEKAASELRTRIRGRFLELGEREAARATESAWISTIHGFCARLLRTHALAAGLDPEFRVVPEHEAQRLAAEAFEGALTEFVGSTPEGRRRELAGAYGPDRLGQAIRAAYAEARGRGVREPSLPRVAAPDAATVSAAHSRLDRAVGAGQARLADEVSPGKQVSAALDTLNGCAGALAARDGNAPLDPFELRRFTVRRGSARALRGEVFDELEAAHRQCLELCTRGRAVADLRLLDELLGLYGRRYEARKAERSALDFDDLELLARDLLVQRRALRDGVRARFLHCLVDELQDTNRLQSDLLELIAGDALFTVGDELQSIYGFRGADRTVFDERRDAAEASQRAVRLSENFRSDPELLDALNAAFEPVFGAGFAPLRADAGAGTACGDEPPVEVLAVDRGNGRWDAVLEADRSSFGATMEGAPAWRAAEARLLARRVDELVGAGEFAAGEVAILLRSWSDVGRYERAHAERGLPTYVAGGGGYWSGQQVGDLRAYMRVLANPRDEEALVSVLASPLVGATLDALALLRWRSDGRPLWGCLGEAFGEGAGRDDGLAGELAPDDRARLAAFVRRLSNERRELHRHSLARVIERAVVGSGYDRAVLSLPGGERRLANVRKLKRFAREFEAEEGRDLRGFLDAVDHRDAAATREGDAPLEGEGLDAVRLMSIHAAKGLEFPLVCVADLGRGDPSDAPLLRVAADGRVGVRLPDPDGGLEALDMRALAEQAGERERAEERRLLWVAATRAERRLIVSGALDLESDRSVRGAGAMEWLAPALVPGLSEAHAAGSSRGVSALRWRGREARVAWTILSAPTLEATLSVADRAPQAGRGPTDRAVSAEPSPSRPRRAPVAREPSGGAAELTRISYSALESYRRCGYRFHLERGLGLSEAGPSTLAREGASADPRLGALDRGAIVHALLERSDLGRSSVALRSEAATLARARGIVPGEAELDELCTLVEGAAESALGERLARARGVRRELPFAFPLQVPAGEDREPRPVLVEGLFDAFGREGDGALVVDYKTDRLVPDADVEAVCRRSYATQRLVYALAALRAGAEHVEVVHLFLDRPADPATARFGASEGDSLERHLAALLGELVAGRYEPSASPGADLCRGCPGRASLCIWPIERTGGAPSEALA